MSSMRRIPYSAVSIFTIFSMLSETFFALIKKLERNFVELFLTLGSGSPRGHVFTLEHISGSDLH